MSKADDLYQSQLIKLRSVAKEGNMPFAQLLRFLIDASSTPRPLTLESALQANAPESEEKLIDGYRPIFFEAMVNEVMEGHQAAIGAMANNLASSHVKKIISEQSKRAAIEGHSQPNGTYDKQNKIRAAWATGKYPTKTKCAEMEHERIGMSLESARKALRNRPTPIRAAARKG